MNGTPIMRFVGNRQTPEENPAGRENAFVEIPSSDKFINLAMRMFQYRIAYEFRKKDGEPHSEGSE